MLESKVPHGQVLGIDQSAVMLDQATRHNRRVVRTGRIQLQQGRFDALPWGANTVDKVLAVNVGYFFRSDAAEIRDARRVLRPGGMMAIYVTDKSAMMRWSFAGSDTHRVFDCNDLVALALSGGGLQSMKSRCHRSSLHSAFRGSLPCCKREQAAVTTESAGR